MPIPNEPKLVSKRIADEDTSKLPDALSVFLKNIEGEGLQVECLWSYTRGIQNGMNPYEAMQYAYFEWDL